MGKRLNNDKSKKILKRYIVSFDLILKKPISERFSEINGRELMHKKEVFYAKDESSLFNKIRLTYGFTGEIDNVTVLN